MVSFRDCPSPPQEVNVTVFFSEIRLAIPAGSAHGVPYQLQARCGRGIIISSNTWSYAGVRTPHGGGLKKTP